MDNNQAANPQGKETAQNQTAQNLKFCKQCGGKIAEAAVICPLCGCQVEEIKTQQAQQPQIVINNANNNVNTNVVGGNFQKAYNSSAFQSEKTQLERAWNNYYNNGCRRIYRSC